MRASEKKTENRKVNYFCFIKNKSKNIKGINTGKLFFAAVIGDPLSIINFSKKGNAFKYSFSTIARSLRQPELALTAILSKVNGFIPGSKSLMFIL